MYLWNIEYNTALKFLFFALVVNCFELCIFEILNTTQMFKKMFFFMLWIALNYVSLKYWIQHPRIFCWARPSCELLWIMYLWNIEYNYTYAIFVISVLWIALNYVSLKYWIQPLRKRIKQRFSCELLWIMYLWNIEYNTI